MKKSIIFITLLFIINLLSAQHFRPDDTVVVFKLNIEARNGMIPQYIPFKAQNTVHWTDKQNVLHKSVLRRINPGYLLLDDALVYPSDIGGLLMSPSPGFFPSQSQKTTPVISDSNGKFNIMTYYDFCILAKTKSLSSAQQHNDPFFKNVSSEKYIADLERKRLHRLEMLAALDTCPLHYGIKTNLVRDLTNEINLSFELPVKRSFCIDFGTGILYTKSDVSRYDFASALSELREGKSENYFLFDHSLYNRNGFTLEVIPKFFLSKKKHLYLGPQLCFRYYYYKNKWIFVNAQGSDDYYRETYAYQSEKSAAIQLNAIFGVQTPQIKKFLFDAFVSVGFMYRGGIVSRSVEKTYLHYGGTHTENYDPPQSFKGGNFSLSGQIGFRLGFRFGKAKLYAKKMEKNKERN